MMDDYIKRSEAISCIVREYRRSQTAKFGESRANRLDSCKNILSNVNAIPASDVRGNVHGKWIITDVFGEKGYECSVCNGIVGATDDDYNFCPWCNADMREGDASV